MTFDEAVADLRHVLRMRLLFGGRRSFRAAVLASLRRWAQRSRLISIRGTLAAVALHPAAVVGVTAAADSLLRHLSRTDRAWYAEIFTPSVQDRASTCPRIRLVASSISKRTSANARRREGVPRTRGIYDLPLMHADPQLPSSPVPCLLRETCLQTML